MHAQSAENTRIEDKSSVPAVAEVNVRLEMIAQTTCVDIAPDNQLTLH